MTTFSSILNAPLLAVCASLLFVSPASPAGVPTKQDIIDALKNRPERADEITGARSLFGKKQRGVTANGGDEKPPSINLKVNFAFDSDRLENETLLTLNTLGNALADDELRGQTIEIVGHTDDKGTDEYNLALSERRAAAVVDYIVSNFKLDRALISSRGMGKRELLDSSDPLGEINRRVEIRNITMQE